MLTISNAKFRSVGINNISVGDDIASAAADDDGTQRAVIDSYAIAILSYRRFVYF